MKYRFKLIESLENQMIEKNITILRKNKNNEIVFSKIYKISDIFFKHYNLKNYNTITGRIELLTGGLNQCPICNKFVLNRFAETCSCSCASIKFHIEENADDKQSRLERAKNNRNYESIISKRLKTMGESIDESGLNGFDRAQIKSKETMRKTLNEDGLNVFQQRALKAAETIGESGYKQIVEKSNLTRKNNNSNGSKTYWSSLTTDEKEEIVKNRKETARETNELSGRWRPITAVEDYEIYFKATSFKHGFKTSVSDEIKLLEEYGVFNSKSNTKGCVRDHLLSRRYGFDNNIPTWIISHPANCEIVLHAENVRRAFSNDNQITLDELLERILNW